MMERLVLDFPAPAARLAFTRPLEVVTARTLADVRPALARIAGAARDGLHAVGLLTYEAAPAFEPAMRVRPGGRLPLLQFGLFEAPEVLLEPPSSPLPPLDWQAEWGREEYGAALAEVRSAIAAGRTYQVNLTTRLRAAVAESRGEVVLDPWSLYERMRRSQGGGYHAYLELGRHVILSASPELFFETRGRAITTRPMKGTRARGRWPAEDRALESALSSSEKDRAENLMIVDLLRSDLGRVCETGSVEVTALHAIERYRTVWQMTSTIRGRLRDDVGLPALFDALFPCGSVTGAPKISTMGEIARLEASPREVYCGAIGWVRPGGDCTFSVPIRTAWLDREQGRIEYGTGGGVVWDSTADGEYDELRAKAAVVREPWPEFALLETLALRDGELVRRRLHLDRMRESATHFGFPFPDGRLHAALDDLARRHPQGDFRARLTLHADGTVTAEPTPLGATGRGTPPEPEPEPEPMDRALPVGAAASSTGGTRAAHATHAALPRVVHAAGPVDSGSPFLYHKTTHREIYDRPAGILPADAFDVLLHNERGEVTEFTRGNVVVELDGEWVTPPTSSGVLPGCLRRELLEAGIIRERVLRPEEVRRAVRVWFVNSARGWIEVGVE